MTVSRLSQSRMILPKSSKAPSMHRAETTTTPSTRSHRSSATGSVARDDKASSVFLTPNSNGFSLSTKHCAKSNISWAVQQATTRAHWSKTSFLFVLFHLFPENVLSAQPSHTSAVAVGARLHVLGNHLLIHSQADIDVSVSLLCLLGFLLSTKRLTRNARKGFPRTNCMSAILE